MCGIIGIYRKDGGRVDSGKLSHLTDIMLHRGPDDSGIYVDGNLGLGMRRLSIQDLSEAGHQPMASPDRRYWIVYNGEVYNFPELRRGLEARGHVFKSRTDTEVVLHSYLEYGQDCLEHFVGMFAFAVWDSVERELFLVRDRLGIKPLYLYEDEDLLLFSSELKAIIEYPGTERDLDCDALMQYLSLGYALSPRTAFAKIRKVLPGTSLKICKGEIRQREYWRLPVVPQRSAIDPLAVQTLADKVTTAIRRRLISDVPLGVFLSGGIDSSAIVAVMAEILKCEVKTFSIGFGQAQGFSELPYARKIARHFGTEHHERVVEPDAVRILPEIVSHLEEPLADTAIVPNWYLSEMAAEYVTVALSGEGGDESFGGYTRYFWAPQADRYHRIPEFLRRLIIEPAVLMLPGESDRGVGNFFRRAKKFIRTASLPEGERYFTWFRLFDSETLAALVDEGLADAMTPREVECSFAQHFDASGASDWLQRLQYVDIHTMLLDDLLMKADKLSMAHSLEIRVPFLDHELFEFIYALPAIAKVKGKTSKALLKEWMSAYLPSDIIGRGKRGFNMPVGVWFREGLDGYARELLLGGVLCERKLLKPEAMARLIKDHLEGRREHGNALFALVVLEHWLRIFASS